LNETESKIHYEYIGFNENRMYKIINNINNINGEKFKIKESKIKYKNIPNDFDWKLYSNLNNDLNFTNEQEAIYHYEFYGFFEKRRYKYDNIPNDFNWKTYIELNNDLKIYSEIEAKKHYSNYGIKEKRKYKYEINIKNLNTSNIKNNSDIEKTFPAKNRKYGKVPKQLYYK